MRITQRQLGQLIREELIGTQQGDVKLDLRDTPGSEASDAGVSDEDLEVAVE